jgi:hypothetical protein
LMTISGSKAVAIVDFRFLFFFSSCHLVGISNSYAQKKKHRKHLMMK